MRSNSIPKGMLAIYERIVGLTDDVCDRQLSCSLSRCRARFSVPRRRMVQAVGCAGQETGPEDAG